MTRGEPAAAGAGVGGAVTDGTARARGDSAGVPEGNGAAAVELAVEDGEESRWEGGGGADSMERIRVLDVDGGGVGETIAAKVAG